MIDRRLRYRDLVAKGVVNNRPTLKNWIRDRGFPPGQMTGPNTRTWGEGEVQEYLDNRPTEPKPVIPARRPRGRPPKTIAAIEAEAKAKIAAVEAETKAKIAKIAAKMEDA